MASHSPSVSAEDLRKQLDSIHAGPNHQSLTEMAEQTSVDLGLFKQLNTPEAVAERFSKVYEKEWQSANASLMKRWSQDKVVYILMRIVRSGFEFCQKTVERQLGQLVHSAESVMINPFSAHSVKNVQHQKQPEANGTSPESVKSQLFTYQQENAVLSIAAVQQHYMLHQLPQIFSPDDLNADVRTYVQTVLAVLWMMSLTSEPLSIYWQPQGETISTEHFNVVTGSSGKTVDWTLWPAVIRQNGGHVVKKGIVLPIK